MHRAAPYAALRIIVARHGEVSEFLHEYGGGVCGIPTVVPLGNPRSPQNCHSINPPPLTLLVGLLHPTLGPPNPPPNSPPDGPTPMYYLFCLLIELELGTAADPW